MSEPSPSTTVDHLRSIEALLKGLPEEEVIALANMEGVKEALDHKWNPNPGQQELALLSPADELFYGGSAGGGKTDLLLGAAITKHKRSLVLRRTDKEAGRFIRRMDEILGHRNGWNGQQKTFTWPETNQIIEFGGCQHPGDEQKYKGEPKDLVAFDEVSDFTEYMYRFIIGWNRTAIQGQRCRIICASNPPTTAEGLWVIQYWAPWLDPTHPNPAHPGELRWFTTIDGRDCEVEGPGPHLINGEWVTAKSRTFIPSFLEDNPDYADTDYASRLAALPEELREAYKEGKFSAAMRDNPFQVIPTKWIEEAMDRWDEDGYKDIEMSAMALDCSGGGQDPAILAYRHGGWLGPLDSTPGKKTADADEMVRMVFNRRKHGAPVVVDVGGGYASGVVLRFKDNHMEDDYLRFDGSQPSTRTTRGSGIRFYNKRAEAYWSMREELDPDQEGGSPVALPRDPQLKADLASATYEITPRGIKIESKDDIRKRLGRSTDKGDAAIMCYSEGNRAIVRRINRRGRGRQPKAILAHDKVKNRDRRRYGA